MPNRSVVATATIVCAILLANLFFFRYPAIGTVSMLAYIGSVGFGIGVRLTRGRAIPEQWLLGCIYLLSFLILSNTGWYYLFGINTTTSTLTLVTPILFLYLSKKGTHTEHKKYSLRGSKQFSYLILAFLTLECGLLLLLVGGRTTDLLRSPWHAVMPTFFVAYAVGTLLLFYFIRTARHVGLPIFFSCIHFFITVSITAILYPLGFGFDAFIHRATEEWILLHGFINPKTPYYIGQYSLVTFLAQLTRLPVFLIDVYLLPTLATILIPVSIPLFLKKTWSLSFRQSLPLVWIIPFVPFLNGYLHLTTPFNIAFLFAILTVFATLAYLKNKLSMSVPLLLSASALACHVLVGAPIVVFVAGALALKKWEYHRATVRSVIVSTGGAILLIVPILFTIRNITLGLGLPSLAASPIAHFFNLFMRPYWYANTAPRIFELLYGWAWCIVPAVIFLGLFGMYIKKDERHIHLFFLTGAASVFFSAWLLRSFIVFPDVAAYEQGDFPLRLIKLSLIFLLPFAMYGTYGITKKIAVRKLLLIIFYTLFAGALTLSLYLAYPQHNPKSRFPGLNVTASDVKTATWIHNQHQEYDYVVLANQLVSAAALKTYSFAHYFQTEHGELFYYSIPTGGALYQEYGRMLYEGQKRKYMEATMDLVDVDTAYFVLNSYWANAEDIIEGAKKTADRWHTIDDGALWIFVYERN